MYSVKGQRTSVALARDSSKGEAGSSSELGEVDQVAIFVADADPRPLTSSRNWAPYLIFTSVNGVRTSLPGLAAFGEVDTDHIAGRYCRGVVIEKLTCGRPMSARRDTGMAEESHGI